ncbi:TIGR03619 family F420-dependent LLM class oxidoreductase [Nocardioides caldifontis]|uniref:TIGR03619 family F420-dependent LLM class oxidoreductase n=1 Tax=Nocardioides caldifontis TaxID=2588938 RepID=UPI00139676AF|nr:TIGR03619 family F420-dependent LLM class oxidoreductase [Nocardioides caldifontis]
MNAPVHIGVKIPNWGPLAGPEAVAATAAAAEERGFGSVWVSDHVAMPPGADASSHGLEPRTPFLDPFTTLSYVAARTTRVQLGTGVYVLPLRPPLLTAKQAASVDVLSGGRLLLGVGVGWLRDEFELLGASWDDRGRRTDAALELVRGSWDGTAAGVEMWPRPAGQVPVLIGGESPAALARTVRLGDGWYGSGITPQRFAEVVTALRARMWRAGAEGELLMGTRAAGVAPEDARATVEAFGRAGATFVVLDAPVPDVAGAVAWVHRTADELRLEPGTSTPLASARPWAVAEPACG